jgi:phospholipid/cholesterol/gamma-HCH transport system substrate-binding protein
LKKVQNEIKIGLTIVIAMLIAVIGFRLMQDVPLFRPSLQLYTYFSQVDGVNPGTSVYMSGVKIGSVNRVRLAGPDSVEVVMNLSYTAGIPVGSRAYIEPADLIGSKRVRIQHSGRDEMIPDGGYIEGVYDHGGFAELQAFADDLKPDIEKTTGHLAGVLGQIDEMLADGGKEDIRQTIGALSQSSQQINRLLQARSADLEESIIHLKNMMASLDTLSAGSKGQLEEILVNLEKTSRELGVVSRELGGVSTELHVMMKQVNSGEGTLGRLIQDPSLYENLDSLAINLKSITRILEEDPRHFLKHMRLVDIF